MEEISITNLEWVNECACMCVCVYPPCTLSSLRRKISEFHKLVSLLIVVLTSVVCFLELFGTTSGSLSLILFLYSGILNLPAFLHLSSPLICPLPPSTKAMSIIGLRQHQQGIPPICHPFTIFPNSSLIISAFKIKVSKSPVIS